MKRRYITGCKDTDCIVFNYVSDIDLLSFSEKLSAALNEDYFRQRTVKNYPEAVKYKDYVKYRDWRQFFLSIISYIAKLENTDWDKKGSPELEYLSYMLAFKTYGSLQVKNNISQISNYHSSTIISSAIKANNWPVLKYQVDKGFDVNSYDILLDCIDRENLEMLKYLVEHGAKVRNSEYNILGEACVNVDFLKYLTEKGGDIHDKLDPPLLYAISFGNLESVKYLTYKKVDVNLNYSLIHALFFGKCEIIKFLIENGAIITDLIISLINYIIHKGKIYEDTLYIKKLFLEQNLTEDISCISFINLQEIKILIRKWVTINNVNVVLHF